MPSRLQVIAGIQHCDAVRVESRMLYISEKPGANHERAQADVEVRLARVVASLGDLPPPARPKALLAGEDLTLNLADLEPAKIHLFSYPATLQNQAEFSSSAARRRASLLPSLPAGAATAPAITSKRASTCGLKHNPAGPKA